MQRLISHARIRRGRFTLVLAMLLLGLSPLLAADTFAQPGPAGGKSGQRPGPQDRPGRMEFGQRGPLTNLMAALRDADLTRDQRRQIRQEMSDHREAMTQWQEKNADALNQLRNDFQARRQGQQPVWQDMRDLHVEMDKLLRSDDSTEAIMPKIAELRSEWFKLRDQVEADAQPLRERWEKLHATAPSWSTLLDEVVAVLTDEQRAQAADAIIAVRKRIEQAGKAPLPGMMMMRGPRASFDDGRGPDAQRPSDRRPMDGRGGDDRGWRDPQRRDPDGRGGRW